jgi:hypothetical protein
VNKLGEQAKAEQSQHLLQKGQDCDWVKVEEEWATAAVLSD